MITKDFYNIKHNEKKVREPRKVVIAFVKKYLNKGMLALDYGCGCGRHMKYMYDNKINVSGLDISQVGCDKTNELIGKNVSCCVDIRVLESDHYNAIICNRVIEYNDYEGAKNTINEFARILKINGYVLITTRTVNQRLREFEKLTNTSGKGGFDFIVIEGIEKDTIQHAFSKNEIIEMFTDARLKIIKLEEKETELVVIGRK